MNKIKHLALLQIKSEMQGRQRFRWWFWQHKVRVSDCVKKPADGETPWLLLKHSLRQFYELEIKPYEGTSLWGLAKRLWRRLTSNYTLKKWLYIYAENKKVLKDRVDSLSEEDAAEYKHYKEQIKQACSPKNKKKNKLFSAAHIQFALRKALSYEGSKEAAVLPVDKNTGRIQKAARAHMKEWAKKVYKSDLIKMTSIYLPSNQFIRIEESEGWADTLRTSREEQVNKIIQAGQERYKKANNQVIYKKECKRLLKQYEARFETQYKHFFSLVFPDVESISSKEENSTVLLTTVEERSESMSQALILSSPRGIVNYEEPTSLITFDDFKKESKHIKTLLKGATFESPEKRGLLQKYTQYTFNYLNQLKLETLGVMRNAEEENKYSVVLAISNFEKNMVTITTSCKLALAVFHTDKYLWLNTKGHEQSTLFFNEQFTQFQDHISMVTSDLETNKSEQWKLSEGALKLTKIIAEMREDYRNWTHQQDEENKKLQIKAKKLEEGTSELKLEVASEWKHLEEIRDGIDALKKGNENLTEHVEQHKEIRKCLKQKLEGQKENHERLRQELESRQAQQKEENERIRQELESKHAAQKEESERIRQELESKQASQQAEIELLKQTMKQQGDLLFKQVAELLAKQKKEEEIKSKLQGEPTQTWDSIEVEGSPKKRNSSEFWQDPPEKSESESSDAADLKEKTEIKSAYESRP